MSLVDAVTSASSIKTEDFTNLVIARVNDYVNVRQMPTEESEVVGKLYNKSVGDELEDAGDWVKIKSGNTVGYVKKEYVVRGEEAKGLAQEVGTRMAKVITTTLYVRKEPSKEAEVIGMVPMDDELTVSEETEDGWVKVSVEEGDGYVSAEFVQLFTDFVRAESKQEEEARLKKEAEAREAARKAAAEAERKNRKKNSSKNSGTGSKNGSSSKGSGGGSYSASGSGTGASVANYALQFVGNPYVYGGSSLTNGADCSGFVMSVYRNFGVSLPHSSGGDRSVGSAVQGGLANAQAGDIVCYSGHVGIYIGNGQIVHASTAATGIKVSSANYRTPLAVRRIF
ncbi:MAG: SH3 domain-containing protein [Lachnospiraceae bacterium]|nr:SH3 domain-containing protein [Lachnospiraceae bacterium]